MIPDPNPILYACVSAAATILAHFSSGHHLDLENLASKCLQNAPPFHRIYTQTIQKRVYIFLIEHPFVYFAIVLEDDDDGSKSRAIEFLTRLKDAFLAWMALRPPIDGADSLAHGCYNDELRPVFRRLMRGEVGPEPFVVSDSTAVGSPGRESSAADAGNGDAENDAEMPAHNGAGVSRECSLSLSQKSGGVNDGGRQQARRIWRKHVRMVLLVDFAICCILFTLWMSICKGFRCVER